MNPDLIAKHFYRYVIEAPYPIERIGRKLTGTVQVARPYSDEEVFELAVKMGNGLVPDGSKLISVEEVKS